MLLHTLNASPDSAAYRDCLRLLQSGDALVLLGDGVYAALPGTDACRELVASGAACYALDTDARLAGVTAPAPGVHVIDVAEFVRLTEHFPRQQAWY